MTWTPYLALQYFWSSGKAYGNYGFILYAGTAVPLQGVWNFFNYARTRQLRQMRGLLSSVLSSLIGSSRRPSYPGGATEQVTRYTTIGGITEQEAPTDDFMDDDYDEQLFDYFTSPFSQVPSDFEHPDYWIASNDSVPVVPSFYPILNSSIVIPNGSAHAIAERIKEVLRNRSIAAVYDSQRAKADCITKNNVSFRIRFYRKRDAGDDGRDTLIVELHRQDGFDLMHHKDVYAIFDAALGRAADPVMDETPTYLVEGDFAYDEASTKASLDLVTDILCPENGILKVHERELGMSALLSVTNADKMGHSATVVSRDLMFSPEFSRLKELLMSYIRSTQQDPPPFPNAHCVMLQALEVISNVTSLLKGAPELYNLHMRKSIVLHLLQLVENAEGDPRAADLSCVILKNINESLQLDDEESARLRNALINANRYGNRAFNDLMVHSQECMELI